MPVERTTDEQGRLHLRLKSSQSLAARVTAGVVSFLVLFVFGPGLLALGTMRADVTCARSDGRVRCEVRESALRGLVSVSRTADDAREAVLVGRDVGEATRVVLLTASGAEVPVVSLSSGRNTAEKEALVSALRAFFNDASAPRVEARQDFTNFFAPVGSLCTLVWLLVLVSALTLPRYALRPQVLVVDAAAKKLSLRERAGSATVREVPFADVRFVSVTMNQGGWVGQLTEAGHTDEAGRLKPETDGARPPLHVALHLANGDRLVFVNAARLTEAEVQALASDVSSLVGAPLKPEPKPNPAARSPA